MPRHINLSPEAGGVTAIAPYNFVPLPNEVFTVEDGIDVSGQKVKTWKRHDEFIPETYSGSVDLNIKTLTPLFVRGPLTRRADDVWDDGDSSRLRPEAFQTPDGRPIIPGSSLRGMVRTLVEILSFAKIQPVSEAKPFFRDMSPGRIGSAYRKHFIEELGMIASGVDIQTGKDVKQSAPGYHSRVQAGLIKKNARGQHVIHRCEMGRIERGLLQQYLKQPLFTGKVPMSLPNWDLQNTQVFVRVDPQPKDYFFAAKTTTSGKVRHPNLYLRFRKVTQISLKPETGLQNGLLVITGDISNKHLEFVFLEDSTAESREVIIPQSIWDRFHDEDQITQWQEKALPTDKPIKGCRRMRGALRDGEPVFFLADEKARKDNPDGLVFLGRAQMFRFPYDKSPEDLIPPEIREAGLDLAEAMFGRVPKGDDKGEAIKGRIFFEDATATAVGRGPDWYEDVLVPRILSAPKVTTFQHYLTQDGTKDKKDLTTYIEGDHTAIRGHKLYWHRWDEAKGLEEVRQQDKHNEIRAALLQGQKDAYPSFTIIKPVKEGVSFRSRIRFENLTKMELGALLVALELPEGCAHRLGMGKPLGLGSVKIGIQLRLVDRQRRYMSWMDSGVSPDDGRRFKEAFSKAILEHALQSKETLLSEEKGLRKIARLDSLFTILEWAERPENKDTRYMVIENGDGKRFPPDKQRKVNEFRTRPVLPTPPHRVAGKDEPLWPPDPPRPASAPPRAGQYIGVEKEFIPTPGAVRTTDKGGEASSAARAKPVQKGQTRQGFLRRQEDKWFAIFEGEPSKAEITNPDKVTASSMADGSLAEFYIVEQNKRIGIKARFERPLSSESR